MTSRPASASNIARLIHPSGRIFVTFSTTFFNTRNLKSFCNINAKGQLA